jgi:ABC-type branched-subunit amino acid transport system permease subunit
MVVYALGAWAMNFQFGFGGIVNFAFIIFESAGAYAAAITSLGQAGKTYGEAYFWGAHWPFPMPLVAGAIAGGLLAAVLGIVTMRKIRRDYQAATFLVIAIIANQVVTNATGFLNAGAGLAGVPKPLGEYFSANVYQWLYVAGAVVIGIVVFLFFQRIGNSPFGRTLRALRDNENAAAAVGKNLWGTRMIAFIVGGTVAGLAGAILVEYIGAWSPGAWTYTETFVLLVAVIFGGVGNQIGSLIGAFLVGVVLSQLTLFLPAIGYPGLIDSLQWVVISIVWLLVLWFRPKGIVPERPFLNLAKSRIGTSDSHRIRSAFANTKDT